MAGGPRVVLLSRRSAERKVWQASQFEFEDVIAAVDDARLLSPLPRPGSELTHLYHHGLNRVGRLVGRPRQSVMLPSTEAVDADLFFAVFASPQEIGALPMVHRQLSRSRVKVAFIVEMYTTDLPSTADYIRQLQGFDHIFVFTRDVLPAVEEIAGVPCTFLATGVDALLFAPQFPAPERSVDVASYGRRLEGTHAALLRAAEDDRFTYSFDTVRGPFDVTDHRDHRRSLASLLKRSRFAVVYKNNDEPQRVLRTGGEETLTNRFFEATAAGAVVLGSVPESGDFDDCFGWPDAVIPIPAPAPAIMDIIGQLDADPARIAAARQAGILAGLRRHDWAYRWRTILESVGMPPSDRLQLRIDRLEERASMHEATVPHGTFRRTRGRA